MIDIIIPTFNRSDLMVRCLKAIKENTFIPYRIIWVDDGSEDKEEARIRSAIRALDMPCRTITLMPNCGPTVAINRGFAATTSEFVVILNNDIIVTHDWLGKLKRHMTDNEDVGIVAALDRNGCTNWEHVAGRVNIAPCGTRLKKDGDTKPVRVEPRGIPDKFFNNLAPLYFEVPRNVPFCCCMISADAIQEVGLLNETMRIYGQDNDFNERLKEAEWRKIVAVDCFVHHDGHATTGAFPGLKEIRIEDKKALAEAREQRKIANEN